MQNTRHKGRERNVRQHGCHAMCCSNGSPMFIHVSHIRHAPRSISLASRPHSSPQTACLHHTPQHRTTEQRKIEAHQETHAAIVVKKPHTHSSCRLITQIHSSPHLHIQQQCQTLQNTLGLGWASHCPPPSSRV